MHALTLGLLVVLLAFHTPIAEPLTDPFHEGEYAVYGALAGARPDFRMPVQIHGALDVLPSRLALALCGADHQIVCVRAVNTGLYAAAVALFATMLAMLTGLGTLPALFAGLPGMLMLWLYNAHNRSAIDAQQGSPSVRDLPVLGGMLLIVLMCRRLDADRIPRMMLAWLGLLTSGGLFWAYNRGAVLALIAGAFVVALCWLRRSLWPGIAFGAGVLAGLALLLMAGGIDLFARTWFDIDYWRINQTIWRSPIENRHIPIVALLTAMTLGAAAYAANAARRAGTTLLAALLVAVFLLYLQQAHNRMNADHLRWVVWPATLLFAMAVRTWFARHEAAPSRLGHVALTAFLLLGFAGIESFAERSRMNIVVGGMTDHARAIGQPIPNDRTLVGPEMTAVADRIRATGKCTFAANNAGLIYMIARTEPCSRFALGIYVSTAMQDQVIDDLRRTGPEIIVYDSAGWWPRIDERSFRSRTPALADWIEANYPVQTRIGSHLLLSRSPLPH